MTERSAIAQKLSASLGQKAVAVSEVGGELAVDVLPENWLSVVKHLAEEPEWRFDMLIDVVGVDFLSYGDVEWDTSEVSSEGYSRGVEGEGAGRFTWAERPRKVDVPNRFAVVVQLLSIEHNQRVRLRSFCSDDDVPMMPSLTGLHPGANWFERETFDMFGIVFEGHPDLRRLLTDYGFVGHAFRKDFPLIGNVEVLYDAEQRRVVYQPVTIEPRVLVPRTIRDDSRYEQAMAEGVLAAPAAAPPKAS
ncbi:MAG: NADH-quinone oxidoreductase subunit C [Dokdonella sp.]